MSSNVWSSKFFFFFWLVDGVEDINEGKLGIFFFFRFDFFTKD